MSVADANGGCICGPSSVAVGGSCARYSVLLPSILVPLIVLGLFFVHLYVRHKRKQADYVWLIKTSDLTFDEPPEILGRGTFGLVVRAEYRGTQVAVKRVIPPVSNVKDAGSTDSVVLEKDSSENEAEDRLTSLTTSTANKPKRRKSNDYFDFNRPDAQDSRTASGLVNAHLLSSTGSVTHAPNSAVSTGANAFDALKLAPTSSARVSAKQYAKLKADFIHEMRLLSKLRHPCITTVMGAVIESGQEPLRHGANGSWVVVRFTSQRYHDCGGRYRTPILRDVAQGLRFLHAATPQVVHGDLKAQNILVDSKFRAKVADFGLSQRRALEQRELLSGWRLSSLVESR
ncbi:guanylate cyclase [Fragilaria crotonensis]|nr:guanylate cyclase [Fragilaria crotonensis]